MTTCEEMKGGLEEREWEKSCEGRTSRAIRGAEALFIECGDDLAGGGEAAGVPIGCWTWRERGQLNTNEQELGGS